MRNLRLCCRNAGRGTHDPLPSAVESVNLGRVRCWREPMETRAAVAHKAGQPLSIETVRLDGPKAGGAMVGGEETGICHTDAYTLSGADPEGLFPAILGHEGAGIVVDVGPGVT